MLTRILMAEQFLFEYWDELWLSRIRSRNSFLCFVLGEGAALAELGAQSCYPIAVNFTWSFPSTALKPECNDTHLFRRWKDLFVSHSCWVVMQYEYVNSCLNPLGD